jgi:alpha-beta hydrolase superfamily lysophospholipase
MIWQNYFLIFISSILLVLIFLYFFHEFFLFHPKKLAKDFKFQFKTKFEEINLKTDDNQNINAVHFKVKKPKGVILYFHGNRGDLTRWGKVTEWFTNFKYDVFVMDYRNYGKSSGILDEKKMLEDAQLVYDFVKQKYNENKIVVYGRSLGTTFATKVASENKPNQLILEVPFYNILSAIKYHIKFSPEFLFKYRFSTNEFIKKVTCPVTFFHGTKDGVTNPEDSDKLFDLVNNPLKKLIKIKNGTHGNLRDFEEYRINLKIILER